MGIMSRLVKFYHKFPHLIQSAIASARGVYLSSLRYGPLTDQMIEEARERETWSIERWESRQEEQLARILHLAATQVPYYRNMWTKRRKNGDKASWEILSNWPILHKDTLRTHPQEFLADAYQKQRLVKETTSGTTGTPLTLWTTQKAVRQWYALCEARWRGWYGLSRQDRWGIFGGQMIVPFSKRRPPFWVWNAGMKQLYLSSYHLRPQNIPHYINAICKHNLVYLLGYASSLYSLALFTLEQKLSVPSLKIVISNAEPLYPHQRKVISEVFQCPVYDTYGQSENVCAASECLSGNLHLWPEVGLIENMDDNEDVLLPAGKTGRLICTGFLNQAMPLIRYEVGDLGRLSKKTSCSCGRNLPILKAIEGRMDDVLLTQDGRRIGRLDLVFKANIPIREAQIIQETINRIRVKYVPANGFNQKHANELTPLLRDRLGDMEIILENVDSIPRTEAGKFQAVISRLNKV
ncbi:MAG: AMP-binding protein, partial [Anaerolineales bacterium]|jgi:phenylacetate-CoA ligase